MKIQPPIALGRASPPHQASRPVGGTAFKALLNPSAEFGDPGRALAFSEAGLLGRRRSVDDASPREAPVLEPLTNVAGARESAAVRTWLDDDRASVARHALRTPEVAAFKPGPAVEASEPVAATSAPNATVRAPTQQPANLPGARAQRAAGDLAAAARREPAPRAPQLTVHADLDGLNLVVAVPGSHDPGELRRRLAATAAEFGLALRHLTLNGRSATPSTFTQPGADHGHRTR